VQPAWVPPELVRPLLQPRLLECHPVRNANAAGWAQGDLGSYVSEAGAGVQLQLDGEGLESGKAGVVVVKMMKLDGDELGGGL
jgi:hypothetical protein